MLYIGVSSALYPDFGLYSTSDITSTLHAAGWFLLPLTSRKTKSNCISEWKMG